MQTEKQRERLVELLDNLPNGELLTKDVADYLIANNVVVLPENALPQISAKIVSEDKETLVVEQEFNFHWKNKRIILKAKENEK